jgi:hypothetical protein
LTLPTEPGWIQKGGPDTLAPPNDSMLLPVFAYGSVRYLRLLKIPCPQEREESIPSSVTTYFLDTSATAFRMLSEVMSEIPYKVFVFPVRESNTATAGVPGTLNFFRRVLKYCMPAMTSA